MGTRKREEKNTKGRKVKCYKGKNTEAKEEEEAKVGERRGQWKIDKGEGRC